MLQVIPLRYGTVFKKAFSDREVFSRFASDVLGIAVDVPVVHTEYSYPEAVGRVKVEYDLFGEDPTHRVIVEMQHIREDESFERFLHYHAVGIVEQATDHTQYRPARDVYTIVVFTREPRAEHLRFSVAVSDVDPVNERGERLGLYRHRMVFLNARVIHEGTPKPLRRWLELIADSLDGEVDETRYPDPVQQRVLRAAVKSTATPDELARIKDEAAWEAARRGERAEGHEEGMRLGARVGALEAARASLLRVLAKRGLNLTHAQRERMQACDELEVLQAWLENAVEASTAEDALR
ncbi:MAG: hypothetical protein U0324_16075 [Polyangiales bacterium]